MALGKTKNKRRREDLQQRSPNTCIFQIYVVKFVFNLRPNSFTSLPNSVDHTSYELALLQLSESNQHFILRMLKCFLLQGLERLQFLHTPLTSHAKDSTMRETVSLKRTRQTSRSNSGCSSEDEATGYSVSHKRSRMELNNVASSSLAGQDPLTPSLKLKDPTRIYNFGYRKKPAELFRKDLISAMKMADSEQLNESDYITITDHWKEEWEKGVQVPVNPDALPSASFRPLPSTLAQGKNFTPPKKEPGSHVDISRSSPHPKLPKEYIRDSRRPSEYLKYELDLIDISWRELMSQTCLPTIPETLIEDVITELERQCAENMKNNKIGIEFNDGVVCDVCRSPFSEDGNEMVFCDTCNVCVHQACYDIDEIPAGEWYCQPCRELGRVDKASCILCPNKNGAMKRTPDDKWAHVSCSLWVVSQIDGDHKDQQVEVKVRKSNNNKYRRVS